MFYYDSSSLFINRIYQYLNYNITSIWHQLLWCYTIQTTKEGGINTSGILHTTILV